MLPRNILCYHETIWLKICPKYFKPVYYKGYANGVFRFKYCVPETLQSNFVHKLKCGSCTASYYGKTYRNMKVRVSEHQGVSPSTGKQVKGMLSTSVTDHMLDCDHIVAWEDFSIIGRESNHYLLETKESLFIKRDNPSLNRNKYSQELFLF